MQRKRSIQTLAVHAGERGARPDYTPTSTPLYRSVGYLYDDMADLDAVFEGTKAGFVYTRYGNPTVAAFERAVATLEDTEEAVAYASGMAAVHAALLSAGARPGATVVAAADVYGATYALLTRTMADMGIAARFVDATDLAAVAAACSELRPTALLCEVISNPLMKLADVPALSEIAHSVGAALVVDSTFASPWLLRPAGAGADYVVQSATKYLAGHGDVLAGVVCADRTRCGDLRARQKLLGANLGPDEAWLALRGLKTLAVRVRQQCENALVVANWLTAQPQVTRVNYPGLTTHPQHALAKRLFAGRGFGGMLSFDLRGAGKAEVFRFFERLEIVLPATTLGDTQSLVLYPAHSSHRALAPDLRRALGIGDGLVRLSVGLEDAADIIADLEQALASLS